MKKLIQLFVASSALALLVTIPAQEVQSIDTTMYWMKIRAENNMDRSAVANTGVSIDAVSDGFVYATGTLEEKRAVEKSGRLEVSFPLVGKLLQKTMDFPDQDRTYHNYTEMKAVLQDLATKYPDLTQLFTIGKSLEGRDIVGIRITGQKDQASKLPGIFFMGGHHAREHLSVEMPLRLAAYLLEEYTNGNPQVFKLVNSRDIQIVPAVNPDGLEYDISTGQYKYWRKNRRANADGTYGVDLNRNYGFQWGTGGSSKSPNSDTYMGPTPFSEPETKAVKSWIESNTNGTILLTFHTFSQLILYPWGHKNDPIAVAKDRAVFEKMGREMAQWNHYTAESASSLYIASGDTVDWAYGTHKIFGFTFELDPSNSGGAGGFYPGDIIDEVVKKNIMPCLYLIEFADNPYRVLDLSPTSRL